MNRSSAGKWSVEDYAEHAYFVPALGETVLALLAPKADEYVLDLGCGNGILTEKILKAGARVLAVDESPEMVEDAKMRGIDARVMDGQALDFQGEFDAVFSNAALHWMPDQDAVYSGVARALKPGGRFVAECGGFGNIATIRTAIRSVLLHEGYVLDADDPQCYPDVAEARTRLEAVGFTVREIGLHARPTPLPTGLDGWLKTFRVGLFDQANVPMEAQATLRKKICDIAAPALLASDGTWIADYVRLRFLACRD